ncbi:MAG: hypothetical protein JWR50_2136 [Mucilaginibacter sp.]|nr:hypothetical protein [Mucilaginibacter sp.]
MKKFKYITFVLLAWTLFYSCKKEGLPKVASSALNVVNALADQSSVNVNPFGTNIVYSTFPQLAYQSNQVLTLSPGNSEIAVNVITDTLHTFYNQNVSTVNGGIYSLYLFGQAPTYQTMLLKDNIPAVQDSSAGVRFINLSPDSQSITINIQGSNNIEFTNLDFKQISNFKMYSAKANTGGVYNFEVRDAASGTLLYTYNWYFRPFFCQTLVISGSQANNTINVFSVNNF